MKIQITSAIVSAILFREANAFGVAPLASSSRVGDSSLNAVEIIDAFTTAASSAATSIAPAAETAKAAVENFSPELLNSVDFDTVSEVVSKPIADFSALDPTSAVMVGAVFGAGGFTVGSVGTSVMGTTGDKNLKKKVKTQTNEIEALKSKLEETQKEQFETQAEKEEAIDQLENKIFLMDQEFEESTAALQKDYANRVNREIEKRKDSLEQEVKFKYDIKMAREREEMLSEKLQFIESESFARQEEISLSNLKIAERESEIVTLQSQLSRSENDIVDLQTMIRQGRNPFNSAKLQLEIKELQTDISKMESSIGTKDDEIAAARQELAELKEKAKNPFYFLETLFQKS